VGVLQREYVMVYRMLGLLVLGLLVSVNVPADAGQKAVGDKSAAGRGDTKTHEGTVISATGKKLVMRGKETGGKEGREHTHMLAPNAKVTCDGKECKLNDLKPGQKVRVTTSKDDEKTATRVEALEKNRAFERSGVKGSGVEKGTDKRP